MLWGNFQFFKCPNIKQIIEQSGHTGRKDDHLVFKKLPFEQESYDVKETTQVTMC